METDGERRPLRRQGGACSRCIERHRADLVAGYEAQLSEAVIDIRNGNVVSEKPVEVKMLNGTVNANRLEVIESGDVIRFDGGVTVTLDDLAGSSAEPAGARRDERIRALLAASLLAVALHGRRAGAGATRRRARTDNRPAQCAAGLLAKPRRAGEDRGRLARGARQGQDRDLHRQRARDPGRHRPALQDRWSCSTTTSRGARP